MLALIEHGKITTTQAKAKSLRPFAEKLISRGKNKGLTAFKMIGSRVGPRATKKLIEISSKFSERQGGYTRITNLPPRLSDGAKMAVIELVD